MDDHEILGRALPKWPQMLVTGKPVTPKQALEIIRRTDQFFVSGFGGNDEEYENWVREVIGIPRTGWMDGDPQYREDMTEAERKAVNEISFKRYEAFKQWQQEWGCIETAYVSNSWIACAFIGGPHGWCHPDGTISYSDNVGKWPNGLDVYTDWVKLATAFPFIEAGVKLMSGESGEHANQVVMQFAINKGDVLVMGDEDDCFQGMPPAKRPTPVGELVRNLITSGRSREHGLPDSVIGSWAPLERKTT